MIVLTIKKKSQLKMQKTLIINSYNECEERQSPSNGKYLRSINQFFFEISK